MSLNPPQQRAVDCRRGPLLVKAGPGSGKTRTVVYRTAALLGDGADPRRTLLVTFTRKAAKEMRSRLYQLVGRKAAQGMWVGTFHATCAKLLREATDDAAREGRKKDFVIYDQDDSRALVKDAIISLGYDKKIWLPSELQNKISRFKNMGLRPDDLDPDDPWTEIGKRIWRHYEEQLLKSNGYDYDDLQLVIMRLLEGTSAAGRALRVRFEHITVDEYQDTNDVQLRMLRKLATSKNICVVGDHRQSVYAFRGANVGNILSFHETFQGATVVDLDINYRSTPQIVACFNAFFDDCTMTTPNAKGAPVRVRSFPTEEHEADAVVGRTYDLLESGTPPQEIAVLYRVHALSRAIEERLRNAGIRYQVVGGLSFYERAEVKDVLAYLRLVANPHSNVDLMRVINTPRRAISPKTLDKLRSVAHAKRSSLWDAIPSLLATHKLAPKTEQGINRFQLAIKHARADLEATPVVDDRPLDLFSRPIGPPSDSTIPTPSSLVTLASVLLDRTGYRGHWASEVQKWIDKSKPVERERAEQKQRNVEEVVAALSAYTDRTNKPTLSGYLEEVALMTDQDQLKDGAVSLMTIHASKGLEFDAVMLVGCEEGLLPFGKAIDEGNLDEEKRLAFVACSRARKHLVLSVAAFRFMYGERKPTKPSRFLGLLPVGAADLDPQIMKRLNGHAIELPPYDIKPDDQGEDDDE